MVQLSETFDGHRHFFSDFLRTERPVVDGCRNVLDDTDHVRRQLFELPGSGGKLGRSRFKATCVLAILSGCLFKLDSLSVNIQSDTRSIRKIRTGPGVSREMEAGIQGSPAMNRMFELALK